MFSTFSLDETTDIGQETGTTVAADISVEESRFNGVIKWVQIDTGPDDKDHWTLSGASPDCALPHSVLPNFYERVRERASTPDHSRARRC